jgi:hypothetical protein
MKTPLDPIVWEEGPRNFAYAYHKVARYDADGGRLRIDVCVMASASIPCPVRITVKSSKSEDPQRLALNDPNDADAHLPEIDDRLTRIGLAPVLAAYCAGDVVALIKREADFIRATQRELESRGRT